MIFPPLNASFATTWGLGEPRQQSRVTEQRGKGGHELLHARQPLSPVPRALRKQREQVRDGQVQGVQEKKSLNPTTVRRSLSYFFHNTNLQAPNHLPEATTINPAQPKLVSIAFNKRHPSNSHNLHVSHPGLTETCLSHSPAPNMLAYLRLPLVFIKVCFFF